MSKYELSNSVNEDQNVKMLSLPLLITFTVISFVVYYIFFRKTGTKRTVTDSEVKFPHDKNKVVSDSPHECSTILIFALLFSSKFKECRSKDIAFLR